MHEQLNLWHDVPVDPQATLGRRRSRLGVLLLLGAAAAIAIVAAGLSPSGPERAAPPARHEGGGADAETAAVKPDAGHPPAGNAAADWQRIANGPEGARAHTAAELTEALLAEVTKYHRSQDLAKIAALRDLLREKSEAEILAAAAALLECGSLRAGQVASVLALSVVGGERRRITDDEAYAILGDTAAHMLAEAVAEPGDVLVETNARIAGEILAAIGSPRATEVLLELASEVGRPMSDLVGNIRNPASVPVLLEAMVSRTGLDHVHVQIALALSKSADGRTELRRLLDPAGGFGWAGHAEARVAAMRILATHFREDRDLAAIDVALRERPDLVEIVTGAMAQHGKMAPLSDAALALPTKTEQAGAIVGFLAGHAGSALERSLLAILGRFPEQIVDPLLARLEAARPGMHDRVLAARSPAK